MSDLDKLDKKLILELERDSKQSLSNIGKKLKTSQQVISYRLKKLQERNIIKFTCLINYFKLNYKNYKIFIKLKILSSKEFNNIIVYLKRFNNILDIYKCSNNFNLYLNIICKDNKDLNSILKKIRTKFSNCFQKYILLNSLENNYYLKDYLNSRYRNINKEKIFITNIKNCISLKLKHRKILRLLEKKSNTRTIDLCYKLDKKPKEVLEYKRYLKRSGIISRYALIVNKESNIKKYILLIRYKDCSRNLEEKILSFFKNCLNVIYFSKILGVWDLQVNIEAKNRKVVDKIIERCNNLFYKSIDNIELIEVYKKYKENCF